MMLSLALSVVHRVQVLLLQAKYRYAFALGGKYSSGEPGLAWQVLHFYCWRSQACQLAGKVCCGHGEALIVF